MSGGKISTPLLKDDRESGYTLSLTSDGNRLAED